MLCSAAAGPKSANGSGGKQSDAAAANGSSASEGAAASADGGEAAAADQPPPKPVSNLVALLCAEPINGRTRMWAGYVSRAAAEAGMRAINSLPQISELLDAPPAQRDVIMPTREVLPTPPTEGECAELLSKCDELIQTLEERLGLAGHASILTSHPKIPASLTVDESLELRLMYLRRLHYFDAMGGGAFRTHTNLLTSCGEAHLPAGAVVHAAQREPLAAPVHLSSGVAAVDAHIAYLSAIDRIDVEFESKLAADVEAFYLKNTVEEEAGKFRCPLSGKLFKDEGFVRKHIDNKHAAKVRQPLLPPRPRPPPPPPAHTPPLFRHPVARTPFSHALRLCVLLLSARTAHLLLSHHRLFPLAPPPLPTCSTASSPTTPSSHLRHRLSDR